MKIAIPKEFVADESRVALVPESVGKLTKAGLAVSIQAGAGEKAYFPDAQYQEAGASLVTDPAALFADADLVLKVQPPAFNPKTEKHEVDLMREGAALITFLEPLINLDAVRRLAARRVTSFSMDAVPRSTRAQKMDALSSMATVAGYKAVLIGAAALPRFFPMLVTAAGTIVPARVLVLGAGVAGLQAIATARRLGAVVWAYDVRPAVKEEIESLGAKFVEMDLGSKDTQDAGGYAKALSSDQHQKELELLAPQVALADMVLTTARVPGIPAPRLVTEAMVKQMRPGSVIVDLAADTGGNCELTEAGKVVVKHGVTLHGPVNVAGTMPFHASQMYSRNVLNFVQHLVREQKLVLDFEDEITRDSCITHEGQVRHSRTRERLEKNQAPEAAKAAGAH